MKTLLIIRLCGKQHLVEAEQTLEFDEFSNPVKTPAGLEHLLEEVLQKQHFNCILNISTDGRNLVQLRELKNAVAHMTGSYEWEQPEGFTEDGVATKKLSERQQLIAQMLCKGYTDKEIALRLDLPLPSVRANHKLLLQKTGAHNAVEMCHITGYFKD